MEIINRPHDLFFKQTMGDREIARDFLVNYLPAVLLSQIDLSRLIVQKDSFIEKELQETFSDLLYKTQLKGRDAYIYFLFEHKSYPLKSTAFQLLKYMVGIWEQKHNKEQSEFLPPIIPLVIYQGRSRWSAPLSLLGLLQDSAALPAGITKHIPNFEYILYDFSAEGDSEIRGEVKLSLYLEIIKNAFNKEPVMFIEAMLKAIQLHSEPSSAGKSVGTDFLETLIRYVLSARQDIDLGDIKKEAAKIKPKGSELIMTIAEKLINEGLEEGKKEGKREGKKEGKKEGKAETAISLLTKKLGPLSRATLAQIKSAEIQTLENILDNIFDIDSLPELEKILAR